MACGVLRLVRSQVGKQQPDLQSLGDQQRQERHETSSSEYGRIGTSVAEELPDEINQELPFFFD